MAGILDFFAQRLTPDRASCSSADNVWAVQVVSLAVMARGCQGDRGGFGDVPPTEPSELSAHRCIGAGSWRLTKGTRVVIPEVSFQVVGSDPRVHLELAAKDVGIAILPL
jgi:hypothetical protein